MYKYFYILVNLDEKDYRLKDEVKFCIDMIV